MDLVQVVILGVVQGLTEFLPVSSSGHLVIAEALYAAAAGRPLEGNTQLNIWLHAGTLLSVLVIYWQRVLRLLGEDRRVLGLLFVAMLPAVVIGLPLRFLGEGLLESPLLAGALLPVTGLMLLWGARQPAGETPYQQLTWGSALIIGLAQSVALLPGISRSGATITAGLGVGLRRDAAAGFAFLLALPAIGGACAVEMLSAFSSSADRANIPDWRLLSVGAAVAFVVGLVAMRWLLAWLERGKLHYFAWWCIPVGLAVVVWQLTA